MRARYVRDGVISALAVSPDGRRLLVGDISGAAVLLTPENL
jgi:hypothetical protein